MVGQRTLDPYARVRILPPQPVYFGLLVSGYMNILLWATGNNTDMHRIRNLKYGDEDFTFCGTRPTQTYLNDKVFFMDEGGVVYGFASYKKYEYTKVECNLEGKFQEGFAIFFVGPFVPLTHVIPKVLWPGRRWRYIKDELSNYL